MNVITNKDIIEFYSGKSSENEEVFQRTYSFEKEYAKQSGDDYICLANTFYANGQTEKDDDNKRFFKWLRAKEEEQTIYQLRALRYLEEDAKFDVFLNHSKLNQKWHCLVSYYAFKEFKGKLNTETYSNPVELTDYINRSVCILHRQIVCPELRLWLLEAATDGIHITSNDVDMFMKEALMYVKDKRNNKAEWQNVLDEYNLKIVAAIAAASK